MLVCLPFGSLVFCTLHLYLNKYNKYFNHLQLVFQPISLECSRGRVAAGPASAYNMEQNTANDVDVVSKLITFNSLNAIFCSKSKDFLC